MIYPGAGAQWRPQPGIAAGSYTGGPRKLVLHTTEGWSIESAEAAYRAKGVGPHFTVDFVTRRWVQHIDTTSSASAVRNDPGGVETNRDGAIQIEIVGFAAYTQDITDDDLAYLGEIVATICAAEGIDRHRHPTFVGLEAGTIATPTAPQRMAPADWDAFDGVCGHQHVPENDHWDPGRFPYERMLALIDPQETMFMYLTEAEEHEVRDRLRLLTPFAPERITRAGTIVPPGTANSVVADPGVRWAIETHNQVEDLASLDPAAVAQAVLAGLDPQAIAAAIPTSLAADVANELAARLARPGP